jgi:choline dehydrogenase-like flavoprotein
MSNLFVVGSTFPTGGVAPPALTIVAFAARLAHHLKSKSSSASSTTVDVKLRRVSADAGLRTI